MSDNGIRQPEVAYYILLLPMLFFSNKKPKNEQKPEQNDSSFARFFYFVFLLVFLSLSLCSSGTLYFFCIIRKTFSFHSVFSSMVFLAYVWLCIVIWGRMSLCFALSWLLQCYTLSNVDFVSAINIFVIFPVSIIFFTFSFLVILWLCK